jgi:hypothetical protein
VSVHSPEALRRAVARDETFSFRERRTSLLKEDWLPDFEKGEDSSHSHPTTFRGEASRGTTLPASSPFSSLGRIRSDDHGAVVVQPDRKRELPRRIPTPIPEKQTVRPLRFDSPFSSIHLS